MENIKILIRKNALTLVGIALGALGGFLYWYFVGCTTGTCPIKSSAMLTMLWGAAVGGLLLSMFRRK